MNEHNCHIPFATSLLTTSRYMSQPGSADCLWSPGGGSSGYKEVHDSHVRGTPKRHLSHQALPPFLHAHPRVATLSTSHACHTKVLVGVIIHPSSVGEKSKPLPTLACHLYQSRSPWGPLTYNPPLRIIAIISFPLLTQPIFLLLFLSHFWSYTCWCPDWRGTRHPLPFCFSSHRPLPATRSSSHP